MIINILATHKRPEILKKTYDFWAQYGHTICIEYNDNQLPAYGRNRILERFYNSDEPWLCMVDDDCILDVRWGLSDKFAKDPINVLERLPKYVTTVFPINPIFIRIAWTLQDPQYQSNWVFERDFTLTNKLVFHRNIKPFYQNTSLTALEDYDWAFQQCKSNYLCVRLNNIVLKEITAKSSYFNNKEERKQKYNESKNKLIELYPELFINNKGHFMKRKLIEKYCNYEKIIQLPI